MFLRHAIFAASSGILAECVGFSSAMSRRSQRLGTVRYYQNEEEGPSSSSSGGGSSLLGGQQAPFEDRSNRYDGAKAEVVQNIMFPLNV